jgi:hypothetical protein
MVSVLQCHETCACPPPSPFKFLLYAVQGGNQPSGTSEIGENASQNTDSKSSLPGAVPTITSVSVELMERLRRQKEARDQAAFAEKRRMDAQKAVEAAEAEWRRLQEDAENLEKEGMLC